MRSIRSTARPTKMLAKRRARERAALWQIPMFCPSVRVRSGLVQARKVTESLVYDSPTTADLIRKSLSTTSVAWVLECPYRTRAVRIPTSPVTR
jgi:hypothetical protein